MCPRSCVDTRPVSGDERSRGRIKQTARPNAAVRRQKAVVSLCEHHIARTPTSNPTIMLPASPRKIDAGTH